MPPWMRFKELDGWMDGCLNRFEGKSFFCEAASGVPDSQGLEFRRRLKFCGGMAGGALITDTDVSNDAQS